MEMGSPARHPLHLLPWCLKPERVICTSTRANPAHGQPDESLCVSTSPKMSDWPHHSSGSGAPRCLAALHEREPRPSPSPGHRCRKTDLCSGPTCRTRCRRCRGRRCRGYDVVGDQGNRHTKNCAVGNHLSRRIQVYVCSTCRVVRKHLKKGTSVVRRLFGCGVDAVERIGGGRSI